MASRMLSTLAVPGLSYLLRPPTIAHFVFVFNLTSVIWANSWNHPSSLLSLSKTALRATEAVGHGADCAGRRRPLSHPCSHLSGIAKSNSRTCFEDETPCCTRRATHEQTRREPISLLYPRRAPSKHGVTRTRSFYRFISLAPCKSKGSRAATLGHV